MSILQDTSMSMLRLGLAVSGQIWKWEAVSWVAGAIGTGGQHDAAGAGTKDMHLYWLTSVEISG
jgi:hypothetical protein